MELRQLRYFVRIIDLGGIGKAALDLGVATSALSQQMSRLEKELGVVLLQRRPSGTIATEAGSAFYRNAQLVLRHADNAISSAQRPRLTGRVSIGLTPATVLVLATPLFNAMRERYPEVEFHFVESFSGYLAHMLHAKQLDLAILFEAESANDWVVTHLLNEKLFAICSPASPHAFSGGSLKLEQMADVPLILPSKRHGMRRMLDSAFTRHKLSPSRIVEVDSLSMLMELVRLGHGLTIQQSAVAARPPTTGLSFASLANTDLGLQNLLVSLPDNELSPAAKAARHVVQEVTTNLVLEGKWVGAVLSNT